MENKTFTTYEDFIGITTYSTTNYNKVDTPTSTIENTKDIEDIEDIEETISDKIAKATATGYKTSFRKKVVPVVPSVRDKAKLMKSGLNYGKFEAYFDSTTVMSEILKKPKKSKKLNRDEAAMALKMCPIKVSFYDYFMKHHSEKCKNCSKKREDIFECDSCWEHQLNADANE